MHVNEEYRQVKAGQVLMRLDTTLSDADGKAISTDYQSKQIALRRIDAELADRSEFKREPGDPEELYGESLAQFRANRLAYETALAQERSTQDKAQSDLAAAEQARTKLIETLPHYRKQAQAYADLAKDGYVSKLAATDNTRQCRVLRRRLISAKPMLCLAGRWSSAARVRGLKIKLILDSERET